MEWKSTLVICIAIAICVVSMAWCSVNRPVINTSAYDRCMDSFTTRSMMGFQTKHELCMDVQVVGEVNDTED